MGSTTTGYLAVLVATLFFGSNFVPVKRYETFDGMYYQWVMCTAIFGFGLLVQLYLFAFPSGEDAPLDGVYNCTSTSGRPDAYSVKFLPFAALGGALWATGNCLSVPVINAIGLSLGLLTWGAANMLTGWATGRFGLFDTIPDKLHNETLNTVGVAFTVVALALYTQIKPADDDDSNKPLAPERAASNNHNLRPLTTSGRLGDTLVGDILRGPTDDYGVEVHLCTRYSQDFCLIRRGGLMAAGALSQVEARAAQAPSSSKRIAGLAGAILAGFLFGNNFTTVDYLQQRKLGPAAPLDYVFSHFCGIWATSTFWFVGYCALMKGAPRINPRLTLPGMVSGLMWAIAQTCWFVANDILLVSVAFPIISSGPGIISAMWGVFVFDEIKGGRNYCVLASAIALALVGCVLIGISK